MNVRSSLLGIRGTRTLDLRPFSTQVLDLMAKRYQGVPLNKTKGLKTLAKLNGIVVPAGDMDGSQVMDVYKENPDAIHDYVGSDVDVLRKLYLKYVNIWW